jgi:outer membrane protein OmpA-like peptidoglycan-associated protein
MKLILDDTAEKIKNINKSVLIEGFTCDLASEKYNLNLGKKRAIAVKEYLLKKGVSKDLLQIKSFGESNPKYPNNSEFGRKFNRRVEIKFLNEKNQ